MKYIYMLEPEDGYVDYVGLSDETSYQEVLEEYIKQTVDEDDEDFNIVVVRRELNSISLTGFIVVRYRVYPSRDTYEELPI